MPTIGEVYEPLIKAALDNDSGAMDKLIRVGQMIFEANSNTCPNIQDGIEAAKRNLDYYCQYHDNATAQKVKAFFGLGSGFRDLSGNKHNFQ